MFKNTKRGSLGVETAIILPIVILGILTIAYLIKVNSINENIMGIALDEARLLNIKAYTAPGNINLLFFEDRLEQREEEENEDCSNIEVKEFLYRYRSGGIDNLISFKVDYDINCNFPIDFYGAMHGNEKIVTRAFVGSDNYNSPRGFLPMEEEEKSEPVWIFPVSGERYHKENCTYIKVAATKTMLTSSVKKKYKPCSLCESKNIQTGGIVYCFFRAGGVYHTGQCTVVDRYVVEIEKNQAEERGYTACLKCGG